MRISVTISDKLLHAAESQRMHIQEELEKGAEAIAQTWREMAPPLFKHAQGTYANSVTCHRVSDMRWEIVNTAPSAAPLESGFTSFDMKARMGDGRGTRQAKDGTKYRIVPFIHGTPGSVTLPPMPKAVYAAVSKDKPIPIEFSGSKWWGMGRYNKPPHVQYFTFRTMKSEGQVGKWLHPGIEAMKIAEGAVREVMPAIEHNLGVALQLSFKA